MYETNVRRRYILRPYVHKKFQQLCSASTPIEDKTLFPSDVTKRMKVITDASKINKQLISGQNITSHYKIFSFFKKLQRQIQGQKINPVKTLQGNSPKKALSRKLNVSKSNDLSFTACGLANYEVIF